MSTNKIMTENETAIYVENIIKQNSNNPDIRMGDPDIFRDVKYWDKRAREIADRLITG